MNRSWILSMFVVALALVFSVQDVRADVGWYTTAGAGYLHRDRDADHDGGGVYNLKVGMDLGQMFSLEGTVGQLPRMRARSDRLQADGRKLFHTASTELRMEGLYHLIHSADREWDPYLAVGGGWYVTKDQTHAGDGIAFVSQGVGMNWNFSEKWFARADWRSQFSSSRTYWDNLVLGSLGFRWGASEADALGDEGGLRRVYFAFDSSELDPQAQEALKENAELLSDKSDLKVTIEGHCDERGTTEYNLALGQRRADSTYQFLRGLGVAPERMRTVSYGEERPADPRSNEEAWAKNRRSQFAVEK